MGRDITKLHPSAQEKARQLVSLCASNGLKISIGECVRTVAEQDKLYAQGRTTSGNKVTNAKGSSYSSMHQWGIAFDFYRNDGKGSYYNDSDGFFTKVGKLGQSIGLEWGGSWKSLKDKPHFQLPNWGSTTKVLKDKYKKPENFFATFVDNKINIGYDSHISTIGWQGERYNGQTSGTQGQSLAIEAIRIFSGDVKIQAQAHVQDIGWTEILSGNDITIGTQGRSKRLEALTIKSLDLSHIIKYRVHIQDIGWSNWLSQGQICGTVGKGLRIEAIEITIS